MFEKVDYKGGFEGMVPTPKATLVLSDDRFTLKRGRRFGTTLLKVWARWTAVKGFAITAADSGTQIEITTGKLGPAIVVIEDMEPIELCRQIAGIKGCAPYIPAEIRSELGLAGEPETSQLDE